MNFFEGANIRGNMEFEVKKDIKKEVNNTNSGKQKNQNFSQKQGKQNAYNGAPYNFVPFGEKIFDYEKEVGSCPDQSEFSKQRKSGEIAVEIVSKTPIMVADGEDGFWKNAYGKYAIPGSSLRGLVRANAQILGFSSVKDDVDDYAIMYRDITKGKNNQTGEEYNNILGNKLLPMQNGSQKTRMTVLQNVKAGYIEKTKKGYVIWKTVVDHIQKELGEMNYYVLSERVILSRDRNSYPFYINNMGKHLQHKDAPFIKSLDRNNKVHYKGIANKEYMAFYEPVSYEIKDLKKVTKVGKSGKYAKEGYVLSSGKMNEKKAQYIIPAIDKQKECIAISDKDIYAFKADYKRREKQLEQFSKDGFFNLPEEGEIKPVFYIFLHGKLYFGFTPRLRLFYDKTIHDGLSKEQREDKLDLAKAMFGFTNKDAGYKSRISFSDAVLIKGSDNLTERLYMLAEPKPTSCADYLLDKKHPEQPVNYNGNYSLRGMKQYWLKDKIDRAEEYKNKNMPSKINSLSEGCVFEGKIRFSNLSEEELGLLLWSIALESNSVQNIGKGKAYGFGNIQINIKKLDIINYEKAYSVDSFALDMTEEIKDHGLSYMEKYQNMISKWLGKDVKEDKSVKALLLMKNPDKKPDASSVQYMKIEAAEGGRKINQYQERKKQGMVLKTVEEIAKK